MADENKEIQDSLKPEELAQLSEKIEKGEQLSEDEVVKAVKAFPGIKKTIDGLYSRAKSAEEDFTKYKQENPPAQPKKEEGSTAPPSSPPETKPAEISTKELLELNQKGLSNLEIASLVEQANKLGVPVSKFVESEDLFQPWLDVQRAKAKAEGATPSPTKPAANFAEAVKEKKSFLEMKGQRRGGE